ncbi:MAG: LysE family translocator [Gammaproteobacteria bacterium]|nr:LysE family translocator [Gammaproteobacteria bacterium]MDP2140831.1 LysE family translocator [Gammaproteobacteria bacterium]MDP2349426.1 LysE family translocator [Gammaproteobacteria bacterium]
MTTDVWLLYVGTVLIFMSTPGPSQLLMLSVSMSNGFHRSLATAAGDLSANTMQILLAGLGLAAVITASRYGFTIIKWAGVSYLIWIGVRQIMASFNTREVSATGVVTSLRQLWLRGFVTSAANPKAVVFFAALFPQFLSPQHSLPPQIAILGLTYIVIDGCFLACYGKGASWLTQVLKSHHKAWVDCVAGAGLIGAAILLGLKGRQLRD